MVGDVICVACTVEVRGNAQGDVIAYGGDVVVQGHVKGDIIVIGGSVQLQEKSAADGDAIAIGGYVESRAGIKPAGDSDSFPYFHLPGQRSLRGAGALTFLAANCIGVLLTALIIRRRRSSNLSASLMRSPVKVLALGVAGLVIWLSIVFLSSKAHSWVALLVVAEAAVLAAVCLPGYAGASLAVGTALFGERGWIAPIVAGVIAIAAMQLIPLVGFFLMLLLLSISLGSAVLSGIGTDPSWLGGPSRSRDHDTQ